MWEVIIRGKFTTGTTIDDEEQAKRVVEKVLVERLKSAGCYSPGDAFQFVLESVQTDHP